MSAIFGVVWLFVGVLVTGSLLGCETVSLDKTEDTPAPRPQSSFARATVISSNGEALTVKHFVDQCEKFVAIGSDNTVFGASLVSADSGQDIALIQISGLPKGPKREAYYAASIAQGRPMLWSLRVRKGALPVQATVKSGELVSPPTGFDAAVYDHFTGDIAVGDSGANIIQSDGRLIGMVVADLQPSPYGGLSLKRAMIDRFLIEHGQSLSTFLIPVVLSCVQERL